MILYQKGDLEAFNCLYEKFNSLIYGYLRKRVHKGTDVDEIFQDIFMRLHHSRLRYKDDFPFEPWLFAVIRNSLGDYFRKKEKDALAVPLDELQVTPSSLLVEDAHNLDALIPKDALLTKSQRQSLELRYGEDFSFEEIAKALGTNATNARQIVNRALKRLQKLIKPEDT